jgi:nitrogen fixation protein NifX
VCAIPLDRELALRIGVAARGLPDDGLRRLMDALVDGLGLPVTAEKLASLTMAQLRSACDGELAHLPRATLRQALGYLRGSIPILLIEDGPLVFDAYQDGDMPRSIRLAVASDRGEAIDGNFSTCAAFLIYQVSAQEIRLIDRRLPDTVPRMERDAHRVGLIQECHLLYTRAINNPATAHLMRCGIHPLRIADGGPVRDKLSALQAVLQGQPPPWLARAMGDDRAMPRRRGIAAVGAPHSFELCSASI